MIRPVVSSVARARDMGAVLAEAALDQYQRTEAAQLAARLEAEATNLANQRAPRRDGDRHKPNTTHLENSFRGIVTRTGRRLILALTTKPGVNAKKVAAIEYGTDKPYEIRARTTERMVWEPGEGGRRTGAAKVVQRQPFEGKHIMRDARDAVVALVRARSR